MYGTSNDRYPVVAEEPSLASEENSSLTFANKKIDRNDDHYTSFTKRASRASLNMRDQMVFERMRQDQNLGKHSIRVVACDRHANQVFGLSYDGDIYKRQTNTPRPGHPENSYIWSYINLQGMQFRDISLTKEGVLFAVSNEGQLFKFKEHKNKMKPKMAHDHQYKLNRVCVTRSRANKKTKVYAIADDGSPLKRVMNNETRSYEWRTLGVAKLKQISINLKKFHKKPEVWGITFKDHVVTYKHATKTWEMVDPTLTATDISVARDFSVFAIRKTDHTIVKFDGQKFSALPSPPFHKQYVSLCASKNTHILAIERNSGEVINIKRKTRRTCM
ncbi:hypothetical protein AKO1_005147 [Acrasis kona]|uniref:Uncharacterized protein n=1 Tax=Acrasis kona TaxID=1008807 RepID=A0AAW2Z696_9EUKA